MRYQEIKEQQDLLEVNMSPTSLARLVKDMNVKAGIEYEMIVPDVGNVSDEREEDYDQDVRLRSIDQAVDFYADSGDFTSRELQRLKEELRDKFWSWFMEEALPSLWEEEETDTIRWYVKNNYKKDFETQAHDEVEAPEDDEDTGAASEKISARVKELINEKTNEIITSGWGDEDYDSARESWESDKMDSSDDSDERSFFSEQGWVWASDLLGHFDDLYWPYYTDSSDSNIEEVADELKSVLNMKVNWSSDYHGGDREDDAYVLEPDSSLNGDESGDAGLELISPPLPLNQLFDDMEKIKQWATERGCKTGKDYGTGLHVNVSVGEMNREQVDYVKLAIILGDEHVLEKFGRLSNSYCTSAISKIASRVSNKKVDVAGMFDKMRAGMNQIASHVIHEPSTDKYTSINMKSNYVEFRSPGGDWLGTDSNELKNTVLRFAVALDASLDSQKYRKEYLKKLYKLLSENSKENSDSIIGLFNQYASGIIDSDQLREKFNSFKTQRHPYKSGEAYVWTVAYGTNYLTVVATGERAAKDKARERAGWENIPDDKLTATPEKKYDPKYERQVELSKSDTGPWGLMMTQDRKFVRFVGSERLRRFKSEEDASEYLRDVSASNPRIRADLKVMQIPDEVPANNSAQQRYELYLRDTGEVQSTFSAASDDEAIRMGDAAGSQFGVRYAGSR